MSDEHQDRTLHRYFDGELSPDEVTEVRARLEAEPALRAKLDGLRELRALVRETVAPALDDVPSDDLWARIEAEIDAGSRAAADVALSEGRAVPGLASVEERASTPKSASEPRLRGIDGGKREGAPGAARGEAGRPAGERAAATDGSARTSAPEPGRGRRIATIAIAGLALAAAILLLVIQPGEDAAVEDPTTLAVVDPTGEPDVPTTAEEDVFRTEVLEVDFGDNSGAIFAVEGEHGERYAVVWLADVQPKQSVE